MAKKFPGLSSMTRLSGAIYMQSMGVCRIESFQWTYQVYSCMVWLCVEESLCFLWKLFFSVVLDSKLEQCVCVKFCFKSSYTAIDTFELFQKAYGCKCLSHTMVFEWYSWFCDSRVSVDDDPGEGRRRTSRTTENIKAVCAVLVQDLIVQPFSHW